LHPSCHRGCYHNLWCAGSACPSPRAALLRLEWRVCRRKCWVRQRKYHRDRERGDRLIDRNHFWRGFGGSYRWQFAVPRTPVGRRSGWRLVKSKAIRRNDHYYTELARDSPSEGWLRLRYNRLLSDRWRSLPPDHEFCLTTHSMGRGYWSGICSKPQPHATL